MLIRYLAECPNFKPAQNTGLKRSADANWANSLSKMSRHTTKGNLFLYNSTPIAWRSKLQKMIAQSLSTVEAEYYAQFCAAVKVICFSYLLTSVGFTPTLLDMCLSMRTTPRASSGATPSSEDKVQNYCKSHGLDISKHAVHKAIQN
jgi:hypothetical protein